MFKRRYLFLVLLAGFGVGLIVAFNRAREPEYGGKRLSEWVEEYAPLMRGPPINFSGEAADAIRHIGSSAIPYLVRWIGYEQPTWKRELYKLANNTVSKLKPHWSVNDIDERSRSQSALYALRVLGPDAAGAINGLTALANAPKGSTSRIYAISALSDMGKLGIPALVGILTNQQARSSTWMPVWGQAARGLGDNAHLDPRTARLAVPSLMGRAKDPDLHVRAAAIYAMEKIDWDELKKLYPQ